MLYRVTLDLILEILDPFRQYLAHFRQIFHPEDLQRSQTSQKSHWHISSNYISPFIAIGDVLELTE